MVSIRIVTGAMAPAIEMEMGSQRIATSVARPIATTPTPSCSLEPANFARHEMTPTPSQGTRIVTALSTTPPTVRETTSTGMARQPA